MFKQTLLDMICYDMAGYMLTQMGSTHYACHRSQGYQMARSGGTMPCSAEMLYTCSLVTMRCLCSLRGKQDDNDGETSTSPSSAIEFLARWAPRWRKGAPAPDIALDAAAKAIGNASFICLPVAVAHHLGH